MLMIVHKTQEKQALDITMSFKVNDTQPSTQYLLKKIRKQKIYFHQFIEVEWRRYASEK